jgi:PAS domain-containing protein
MDREHQWTNEPFAGDWMFAASAEPMLIVVAASGRIIEANPPAAALLRVAGGDLIGNRLSFAFDAAGAETIEACIAVARVAGSAHAASVRARHGGPDLNARISVFRVPPVSYLLVRVGSNGTQATADDRGSADSVVFRALDNAAVGFLVTDREFLIHYANRAFLGMVERRSQADVCGSSLGTWLGITDEDLSRLRLQLSQRLAATALATHLGIDRNRRFRVEVCAVAVPAGRETCWGFSVTGVPRLN